MRESVQTACLDDVTLPRIGFIKIDVEGHELNVLEGAKRTISRDRPTLLIECEERHNPGGVSKLRELFRDAGYEGRFLHMDRMRSLDEFDVKNTKAMTRSPAVSTFIISSFSQLARQINSKRLLSHDA